VSAILELHSVSRRFGGLLAVNKVTLDLHAGEIVGLIGPNGAGKTTLVNLITGVYRPSAGEIRYRGERIDGVPANEIACRGIARTFQVVQPFPRMTVLDNVAGGALFAGGVPSIRAAREKAMEHLQFTGLAALASRSAAALTLADRKRLELAKSLATNPRLLLLDEVNAGLNAAEIDTALELIQAIAARGITILLIEHVMKVVLRATTRVIVLHHGELIADDQPDYVMRDPRVIEAYLGSKFAAQYRGAGSS
jgi:branched-chain amino acid transport system ATP-binding protein